MADETEELLDAQTINQAKALGLAARYVVEGYMTGEHKSPFRGFSVEFTQHREYVAGDDTRHLDWKVLGRTDRFYLKQYEQETNFVAHLLLDGSESMKYGSGKGRAPTGRFSKTPRAEFSKLEYGRRIAACLAFLILQRRDAVAVGIFDQAMRSFLPRSGNLARMRQILLALAGFQPDGQTGIGRILHDMAGQIRQRGIVILISDLFDDESKILEGIQHLRFGGHEVIVFHVMDPFELEFPFQGNIQFEGLEGAPMLLARPAEIRATYMKEVNAFRDRMREGCEKQNCHYVLVNTAQPLHEAVSAYLAFRLRTTMR